MIDVLVSNDDRDRCPAAVDPDERHQEGYVKPWFDLETVRRIAVAGQCIQQQRLLRSLTRQIGRRCQRRPVRWLSVLRIRDLRRGLIELQEEWS
ncbi:hypothetical protein [Streptomyces sp. NPDC005148]